jgi:hypothetical protein
MSNVTVDYCFLGGSGRQREGFCDNRREKNFALRFRLLAQYASRP